MGKAGRFACIFVPMALSIASLICLTLVMIGGTNSSSALLRDLYFMKIDASEFNPTPDNNLLDGIELDDAALGQLITDIKADNVKDVYTVHLWNYCDGDVVDGKDEIKFCSPRKSGYFFNVTEVWNLTGTAAQEHFPSAVEDGLKIYEKVASWMFAAYVIGIIATAVEIVVGIFAIFSRWGSLATTIVTSVSSLFVTAAAITSTATFSILTGAFNGFFRPYNIKTSLSTDMLAVVWLAVAFSLGAGFFWMISVCCCSGKSGHRGTHAEKTPYTYERVASPYMGSRASDMPLHPVNKPPNGAYEPFRQQSHV